MTALAERLPDTPATIDLDAAYRDSGVGEVLEQLDRDLVGLKPVNARIREIAALLLVDKLRRDLGLSAEAPTLHMSFTGNPGTGKTTVAMRMADILHRLGYTRSSHLVSVTRDDLVGQYIGHTAPKTKEILKKAMGGVLFIDEAYYLYRPENERDYGQESIEILLQPPLANARSIHNALDRARLRQANRLFNRALDADGVTGAAALQTLTADD